MYERLQSIAQAEKCHFNDEEKVLSQILDLSGGDMRRAVTTLQSAHALSGDNEDNCIQVENIAEIAGLPTQQFIDKLIDGLSDGSFAKMEQAVNDVVAEGYSAPLVINSLLEHLILSEDGKLGDQDKALLSIKMGEADKFLVDGADDLLQLLSVCSLASKCIARKRKSEKV